MSRRLRDEAWGRIRDGLDVSTSAKVLLLAIAEHCDGELRAAEKTIAEWIDMSTRSVSRLLAELIEVGCLMQTARSARGHVPRFAVFPDEETLAKHGGRNTRQRMADVDGPHPLRHTPTSDEHTPTLSGTHAKVGDQNQKEPEEPAAGLANSEYLTLAIEEAKRTDTRRRANGGEPIEDIEAWAAVKAKDPTWRAGIDAERRKDARRTNRERSIARCDGCDSLGFIDYDDGSLMGGRRKCTHPDLAKELTA